VKGLLFRFIVSMLEPRGIGPVSSVAGLHL